MKDPENKPMTGDTSRTVYPGSSTPKLGPTLPEADKVHQQKPGKAFRSEPNFARQQPNYNPAADQG